MKRLIVLKLFVSRSFRDQPDPDRPDVALRSVRGDQLAAGPLSRNCRPARRAPLKGPHPTTQLR
jgi:hypothetical protein